MRTIAEWGRRIWYRLNRRRMEDALQEEMQWHRSRMNAPARFGNVLRLREEARDVWGWTRVDETLADVRHATRTIRRMPGLAAVVILSLGVGIGVNTAVFSWIQTVVLEPIPGVDDPSGFYLIEPRSESGGYPGVSWPEYRDLRDGLDSFEQLLAFRIAEVNLGEIERNERVFALLVSSNYFSGLGLEPALGSFPGDAGSFEGMPVVVSHSFWQTRFGGADDAIGRGLQVNGRELTVAGVTPPGFRGTVTGLEFGLWIPAPLAPVLYPGSRELEDREQRGYSVTGRLAPGASLARARGEVTALAARLAEEFPEAHQGFQSRVLPFWRAPRGGQRFVLPGLLLLEGVLLLLLLAVCGNTANLLLARATARRHEIGIRAALGAGRSRLLRLLMTESVVLGLLGAGVGILIAAWGTTALRAVRFSTLLPVRVDTGIDAAGIAVAAALGIASALAFGAAPALQLTRKAGLTPGSSPAGTGPKRMRKALMSVEAGLALMVLLAGGLFLQSFRNALDTDPGFQPEGLLLAAYDLSSGSAGFNASGSGFDGVFAAQFTGRLLDGLKALPEVESAAIAAFMPLDIHGLPLVPFSLEGRPQPDAAPDRALINIVTPEYFETMRIPRLRGPGFAGLDNPAPPPQAVVNEEFVRRFLDGADPVGRWIESGGRRFQIAGVVGDSVYRSFGEPPIPFIYYSYRDRIRAGGQLHVRTRAGSEAMLVPAVGRVLRTLDPGMPLFDVRTMAEHIETNLFLRRIPARMFAVLAPFLLLLAAVGVYGVVAYNVARRRTEIGVRMALGASNGAVVRQIAGESMGSVLGGMAAGWMLTFGAYDHILPGAPLDPVVFLGVPALLAAVAMASCALPVWRATRSGPMTALRQD